MKKQIDKKQAKDEFLSLLNDDIKFNYGIHEFNDWIKDYNIEVC